MVVGDSFHTSTLCRGMLCTLAYKVLGPVRDSHDIISKTKYVNIRC